ncbi:MAG TPA: Hsp20/alpha crystallin family protein [Micromonosporaceae bacterium]|nr:Hsp20/alpha crystallin family protein [Micromonosporaceae bacterium]
MGYPVRRPSPYGRSGWDPVGELSALRSELNRMVGSVLGGLYGERGWFGDVDLEQSEDGWTVTARLPGVAPEEVLVELDDRELCIRAAAAEDEEEGEAAQRTRRGFNYRLVVPGDVDPDGVDATMDHGLLTVRLPRSTRSRRRSISVGRTGGPAGSGGPSLATGTGVTGGPSLAADPSTAGSTEGSGAGISTAGAASPDATASAGAVVDEQLGGAGETGTVQDAAPTEDETDAQTAVPPVAAQQGEPGWPETTLVDTTDQPAEGPGDSVTATTPDETATGTGETVTGIGEREADWPEPPRPAGT